MSKVIGLGYVGFEVADLVAWRTFMEDVLGFGTPSEGGPGLGYRMDDFEQRIVVREGPLDDLAFVGWEVAGHDQLDAVAAAVEAHGISVDEGPASLAEERRVARLVCFEDPHGVPTEIFVDPARTDDPLPAGLMRSSFLTGSGGLGHIAYETKDYDAALAFYQGVLGFEVTDYVFFEGLMPEPGMTFLHCNPRHHSLVLGPMDGMSGGKRMHHLMIEVTDAGDVVRAYDRVLRTGTPVHLEMGRHNNDTTFSFYALNPSVTAFEFGWGSTELDESWQVKTWGFEGAWGHSPSAPVGSPG